MKKILIACAMAAGLCLVASGAQADRGGGGHGGGGHGSGFHGGGGHSFHGGNFHGGHFHGGHFHGRGFGGSVFIVAPLFWTYYGYPYYYDYPAYSYDYPAYSYYDYPSDGYAQPAQPQTQFYCPDAGYYPTVKTCPQGWLRVVPDNAPPQ